MSRAKSDQYRGGISVFPDAPNRFDQDASRAIRELLISEINTMQHPTRTQLASRLGILRERAGRLVKIFKLENLF